MQSTQSPLINQFYEHLMRLNDLTDAAGEARLAWAAEQLVRRTQNLSLVAGETGGARAWMKWFLGTLADIEMLAVQASQSDLEHIQWRLNQLTNNVVFDASGVGAAQRQRLGQGPGQPGGTPGPDSDGECPLPAAA